MTGSMLPGQRVDADEQCRTILGDGWTFLKNFGDRKFMSGNAEVRITYRKLLEILAYFLTVTGDRSSVTKFSQYLICKTIAVARIHKVVYFKILRNYSSLY